jgi:methylmalonyl-CoA/ethylmalonyl-CoA epimerase
MNLKFHHIGIACKDILEVIIFLENSFNIVKKSKIIEHKNHGVTACIVTNFDGTKIELVSGITVEKFIKKRQYLYHNCWEVEDINLAVEHLINNGSMLISEPKPSELFNNRKVAFLLTDIGIMELLEKGNL